MSGDRVSRTNDWEREREGGREREREGGGKNQNRQSGRTLEYVDVGAEVGIRGTGEGGDVEHGPRISSYCWLAELGITLFTGLCEM